jgi:hypothetical protein
MPAPHRGFRAAQQDFTRRRFERRVRLAAAPIAVHAGHDHRAAWPVFLNVGCRAIPHRIAAREIARIDTIRFRLVVRIDRHASRRPSSPDSPIGLHGGGWRRLRGPHPGRCGLRFRSRCGHRNCPDKGEPDGRRLDPLHHAHPNLLSTLRSPIAAPTSTGPKIQNQVQNQVQNRHPASSAGQPPASRAGQAWF